ncbi:Ca2+-binding EF-hand superfamily protein [Haloferula luteola]|uniref:Ca2+-binding EF-hand superfamily protein n=1 Tax=Haloferula luteola TaxID=595692 RepID=A0A840V2M0_9BACT|nr:EF-hand domain-containing protein [Haloferula luteola]MBB5351296.1 Ca2+-binding EF-hand superfamily protein [Haloferula luteola]
MKPMFPLFLLLAACASEAPHSEEAHNRKVMALQEKFDRFDYDANGELTKAEVAQGVRESGVTGVTEADLDALMKHYDVNRDGGISRWETQRAIDSPLPEDLH